MRDKELTKEVLRQIDDAAAKIITRFQTINAARTKFPRSEKLFRK